jgi:hypothetical protein
MRFLIIILLAAVAGVACLGQAGDELAIPIARLKVFDCQPVLLATSEKWRDWPEFIRHAMIYEPTGESNNELRFEVLEGGMVLLAASWTAEGSKSGAWRKGKATEPNLVRDGWTPIGKLARIGADGKLDLHTLYRQVLTAGQTIRLHTRKFNPPRVLLVPGEQVAAVLAVPSLANSGATKPDIRIVPRLATTDKKEQVKDFVDQPGDGAVLVGLRVGTDYLAPRWGISSLEPIYERRGVRVVGQRHGQPGSIFVELQAEDGYAVGAIIGSIHGNFAGLRLIFMRRTESGLDTDDSYESRWVGLRSNAEELQIGGDSKSIVGLRGTATQVVRSLELITAE